MKRISHKIFTPNSCKCSSFHIRFTTIYRSSYGRQLILITQYKLFTITCHKSYHSPIHLLIDIFHTIWTLIWDKQKRYMMIKIHTCHNLSIMKYRSKGHFSVSRWQIPVKILNTLLKKARIRKLDVTKRFVKRKWKWYPFSTGNLNVANTVRKEGYKHAISSRNSP